MSCSRYINAVCVYVCVTVCVYVVCVCVCVSVSYTSIQHKICLLYVLHSQGGSTRHSRVSKS